MKKEEIITIIIIAMIMIGDFFSQRYTAKCMDEMSEKLTKIKEQAISETIDSEELTNQMSDIYDDWLAKDKFLSYYIEHAELEKVNTQLRRAKAYFEANIQDQCVPEIENAVYVLEHIKAKQAFSLRNVF